VTGLWTHAAARAGATCSCARVGAVPRQRQRSGRDPHPRHTAAAKDVIDKVRTSADGYVAEPEDGRVVAFLASDDGNITASRSSSTAPLMI
jgi:hypothetical protein